MLAIGIEPGGALTRNNLNSKLNNFQLYLKKR